MSTVVMVTFSKGNGETILATSSSCHDQAYWLYGGQSGHGTRWSSHSTNALKNDARPSSSEQGRVWTSRQYFPALDSASSSSIIVGEMELPGGYVGCSSGIGDHCHWPMPPWNISMAWSHDLPCVWWSSTFVEKKNRKQRSPKCTSHRVTSRHYPYFTQDVTTNNSRCFTRRSQVRTHCGFY